MMYAMLLVATAYLITSNPAVAAPIPYFLSGVTATFDTQIVDTIIGTFTFGAATTTLTNANLKVGLGSTGALSGCYV